VSKRETEKKPAPAAKESEVMVASSMSPEEASRIIYAPYVTEKTFNQIEKENKLAFMVSVESSKTQIIEAIRVLYEAEALNANTAITIHGKKAFVTFKAPEGARDLATKLGLV
jgi:large subunit ribosomal protein L23